MSGPIQGSRSGHVLMQEIQAARTQEGPDGAGIAEVHQGGQARKMGYEIMTGILAHGSGRKPGQQQGQGGATQTITRGVDLGNAADGASRFQRRRMTST